MNTIEEIKMGTGTTMKIRFSDGLQGVIDLAPLMADGGVFTVLKDPEIMRSVRIGERGRFIEWPEGLDLCADAIRLEIEAASSAAQGASTT